MLRDHIQQDIFWAFQTGGCVLLHESSAESSCMSFLHYFHTAISNHLSEKPEICFFIWSLNTGLTVHKLLSVFIQVSEAPGMSPVAAQVNLCQTWQTWLETPNDISLVMRKQVFGVSDQVPHKPGFVATVDILTRSLS